MQEISFPGRILRLGEMLTAHDNDKIMKGNSDKYSGQSIISGGFC